MNANPLAVSDLAVSVDERFGDPGRQKPADLRQLAIQSLEAHSAFRGRLEKCGIEIESEGGKLVLNGRVPSWHLKQILQETVRRIDGVQSVENHVKVVNPGDLLCKG